MQLIRIVNLTISATAKIVYNADLQVFDNPTEETEEFLAAIKLISNSIFKLLIEPPFFKLYRNKVYRDIEKGFTVGSHHVAINTMLCESLDNIFDNIAIILSLTNE